MIWITPTNVLHNTAPCAFCTICGHPFYPGEMRAGGAYERHVVSHTPDELAVHSPAMQAPHVFGTAGGDEDWTKWVAEHRESDPHGWEKWGRTDDGKHSSGLGDG